MALLTLEASLSSSFRSHRHGLKLIQSYMLHAGQDPYLPVTLSKSSQPASHSIPRACTCAAKPPDWTTLLVGKPPSPDPRSVPGEVSRRPAYSQHSGIRGLASSTRPSALLSLSLFQSSLSSAPDSYFYQYSIPIWSSRFLRYSSSRIITSTSCPFQSHSTQVTNSCRLLLSILFHLISLDQAIGIGF